VARLNMGRVPLFAGGVTSGADPTAGASPKAQTTLLGLGPLLASLPRTWKAVISIRMPNAMA
jgi:hypothetical protein